MGGIRNFWKRNSLRYGLVAVTAVLLGASICAADTATNRKGHAQSAQTTSSSIPDPLTSSPMAPIVSLQAPLPSSPQGFPLLDAWMYPDEPRAQDALQNTPNIHALKAEFFHVKDDGWVERIDQSPQTPNGYSPELAALIKRHSREQYITVSATMDASTKAMRNPNTIPRLLSLAEKTGFGIELDWEEYGRWTPEYYHNYKDFLRELRPALQAKGLKLMIDGPPIYDSTSQSWYQWKYEELSDLTDEIVMMVYDNQFDTGVGGSIAPGPWSLDCMSWLKDKTDGKGIAGVAAYGYRGQYDSGRITVNTSDTISRLVGASLDIIRNDDGELTADDGTTFYAYADEQTMQTRRSQVQQSGLQRLSVWSLGSNPWFPDQ